MRSIQGRLVLAIVVVGCVPLLIGLILASMAGMRSLGHVIGGNVEAIAAQVAERVRMLVDGEVQGLRLLASAPLRVRLPVTVANETYPADSRAVAAVLEERATRWETDIRHAERLVHSELSLYLREHKVSEGDKMVGLLIVDAHGALVAASSQPGRYRFDDEPWWAHLRHASPGGVFISELIPGRAGDFRSPEETIDVAVPIFDDHQRRLIGAIKASYRFDALFALVNHIRIGQTGHAMLFSADGHPLVCPILPRQAHRIPADLIRLIVSNEPGWVTAADDGHGAQDTVVGFAPVRGLGAPDNQWHIFVRQHPSESYAPIRQQFLHFGLIGLGMVILLAVLGRVVAGRIARPIQMLREGVEAIRKGTYRGPLAIRTGDEFETLAAEMHRMAEALDGSRAALEALNRDLATRIEEKTAEVTRQMRKLETSERLAALGKVASGIAHEINNPLGIIVNRIECMEAEARDIDLPAPLARDLSAIRTQADRITRVVQSMLTLSRGSATTHKPIDLGSVVETALALAGERLSARHIRVEMDVDRTAPPVMGDRARLETVIVNLLNNAIDAVHAGGVDGWIRVRVGHESDGQTEWVTVEVRDNGPGLAAETLPRIFDPFFTTKPPGQGNGLGLFLSYGIVAEHRGRLEARNADVGAVFAVSLPGIQDLGGIVQDVEWESRVRS